MNRGRTHAAPAGLTIDSQGRSGAEPLVGGLKWFVVPKGQMSDPQHRVRGSFVRLYRAGIVRHVGYQGFRFASPPASVVSHADGILSEPRAQASGFYAPRRQLMFAFLETTLLLRHYTRFSNHFGVLG
jgi:hypothetical protein